MKYKLAFAMICLSVTSLLTGCNVSSFGEAVGSRGSAAPANASARTSASPADAAASDAQPGLSLAGEFDNGKALQAMYGSYNADLKRAQWKPTKGELDRFNFYNNIQTLYSKAYFTKQFQQNGTDRYFVITRTAPSKADCADCVPVLGGAVFTKVGEEWRLDSQSKALTRTGLHGELSGGRTIKLSADKTGVLFHWKAVNDGIAEEGDLLIAETSAGLKEVFSMVTGGNNRKQCEDTGRYEDDPSCWAYSSKLEFVTNPESKMADVRVTTTGNKPVENDEIVPIKETKRFVYSENAYRPVR